MRINCGIASSFRLDKRPLKINFKKLQSRNWTTPYHKFKIGQSLIIKIAIIMKSGGSQGLYRNFISIRSRLDKGYSAIEEIIYNLQN